MATAPSSTESERHGEIAEFTASGSDRFSYAIREEKLSKTKFITHLWHMARQSKVVIAALPKSLLDDTAQMGIRQWCHQSNLDATAKDLTSPQPSEGRLFLFKKKILREPMEGPLSDFPNQPNLLYLHGAQTALEADCDCREHIVSTLCDQLDKSNARQVIVLFDIDGHHPKFVELADNCKAATVYQYHSSTDGIRFDEEGVNGDDGDAVGTSDHADAVHPMIDDQALAGDLENFGIFDDAKGVEQFERRYDKLRLIVDGKVQDVIGRHRYFPIHILAAKIEQRSYRQARLGQFLSVVQGLGDGGPEETPFLHAIGMAGFEKAWEQIRALIDEPEDRDLIERKALLMAQAKISVTSKLREAPELYDSNRHGDCVEFARETYGWRVDPQIGTIDAGELARLDKRLANKLRVHLSALRKKSMKDDKLSKEQAKLKHPAFLPSSAEAAENSELLELGYLTEKTASRRWERLRKLR